MMINDDSQRSPRDAAHLSARPMLHLGEHLEADRRPDEHRRGNPIGLVRGAGNRGGKDPIEERRRHRIASARDFVRMPGARLRVGQGDNEFGHAIASELNAGKSCVSVFQQFWLRGCFYSHSYNFMFGEFRKECKLRGIDVPRFVRVQLSSDQANAVDAWASANGVSRPEAIRRLVERGLKRHA
jgi:hypothetical protein